MIFASFQANYMVYAGVAARVEALRRRMSDAEKKVEGLFESLLSEGFGG
jgi:hypothetical protein